MTRCMAKGLLYLRMVLNTRGVLLITNLQAMASFNFQMELTILENSQRGSRMDMENRLILMILSTQGIGSKENGMEKE